MKTEVALDDIRQQLGADRVLDPPGALPQPAERLDPSGPVRPYEFEVAVERLWLDSTSFRNIRERAAGDADRMAERIIEIVESRGKLHNPETESGGVLLGTVTAVGERYESPPATGDRIVTLASLTLTPLRLEAVRSLDPGSPQVEVSGTAYVFERAAWAPVPDDLPLATGARDLRRLRRRLPDAGSGASRRHGVRAGRRACRQAGARRRARRGGGRDAGRRRRRRGRDRARLGARPLRHRRDRRPARPARRPRRGARRRRAARPTSRWWWSTPQVASRPRSC